MMRRTDSRTPAEIAAQNRANALAGWAARDRQQRRAVTAGARRGLAAKFADSPNPDAALAAHMARMTAASLAARRKNAA